MSYSTLGSGCPFGVSSTHLRYCSQLEMERGDNQAKLFLDDQKFNLKQSVYDAPAFNKNSRYLDSPFPRPLLTPEQAKVVQNPNNAGNR